MNLKFFTNKLTRSLVVAAAIAGTAMSSVAADVEKIVGVFFDQVQATSNGAAGNYGIQIYSRNAGIDASGHEINNLVLEMDMYIQNLDNPGNLDIINQAVFNAIEVGNEITDATTWKNWAITTLKDVDNNAIQAGKWQHYRLALSEANGGRNIDLAKPINYFRWCLARIPVETLDAYQIRFKDIKLVDKTQFEEEGDGSGYDNTDYLAAELPISGTINLTSKTYNGGNINKKFDPAFDLSHHDPRMLYLQFDADITESTPGDILALKKAPGQIEITSGGRPDTQELCFNITTPDWKTGKHTYTLAFSTAGVTGGAIDYSAVNYLRIYAVHIEEAWNIDNLKVEFSNFKVIDRTNETKLPTLFSSGMMFQQNKPMNIWGYAASGREIKVKLYKAGALLDSKSAVSNKEGRWDVNFDAQQASFDKYSFEVIEDETVIQTVDDILVGEIWVAAGQSNMALTVASTQQANDLMTNANNDNIRFLFMPTYPYSGNGNGEMPSTPTADIAGAYWGHGNNGVQVGSVSAVAYIAIKELQEKLGIPVGFLYTPIGGSVIEAWIPRQELDENTALVNELQRRGLYYDETFWVHNSTTVTALYNQKIGPLAGFNVAGVLWYQGESNSGRPELYADELLTMKKGWERTFNFAEGTMPFVFCQVGRWAVEPAKPHYLAALDEAMYDAWANSESTRNTMALLPIYDTDMTYDGNVVIHPTNKGPVGNRFATSIYNLVYNTDNAEYTAPVFEEMSFNNSKAIVKFSHVGSGLKTIEGHEDVRGFAICDSRGVYVNANARIVSDNEVEVWSDGIDNPANVTYAYSTYNYISNLCNSEGIPAAPFRSVRAQNHLYYNPQDWTHADHEDIWAITQLEGATSAAAYVKSWESPDATLSFDTNEKYAGAASLCVSYDKVGTHTFGPNTTPLSIVLQLNNFKYISMYVLNPDNRAKTLELIVEDKDGNEVKTDSYAIPATETSSSSNWTNIVIDLSKIGETTLKDATNLKYSVNDSDAGSILVDNVTFGLDKMISTGISNIATDNEVVNRDSYYYDLVGRRYSEPKATGFYIHAGKKVFVRK